MRQVGRAAGVRDPGAAHQPAPDRDHQPRRRGRHARDSGLCQPAWHAGGGVSPAVQRWPACCCNGRPQTLVTSPGRQGRYPHHRGRCQPALCDRRAVNLPVAARQDTSRRLRWLQPLASAFARWDLCSGCLVGASPRVAPSVLISPNEGQCPRRCLRRHLGPSQLTPPSALCRAGAGHVQPARLLLLNGWYGESR